MVKKIWDTHKIVQEYLANAIEYQNKSADKTRRKAKPFTCRDLVMLNRKILKILLPSKNWAPSKEVHTKFFRSLVTGHTC